jgi:hypothetical protein
VNAHVAHGAVAGLLSWPAGLSLALVLIYLVLAAQFESFTDPFVILLTVPLALVGALFALWYFNQTLNIFSQIGLIMLIGLVTKNGILIVEFANQRRATGSLTPLIAVQEAAAARLRPILMTSLATVLGILPIALALGAGSESRMSMGIAVIGGLMLGSALAYQGKFIAALRAFRAAADFAPDNARAHWACGVALLETGNRDRAPGAGTDRPGTGKRGLRALLAVRAHPFYLRKTGPWPASGRSGAVRVPPDRGSLELI